MLRRGRTRGVGTFELQIKIEILQLGPYALIRAVERLVREQRICNAQTHRPVLIYNYLNCCLLKNAGNGIIVMYLSVKNGILVEIM